MSTIPTPTTRDPFVDPQTGRLTRSAERFIIDLFRRVGGTNETDLSSVVTLLTQAISDINTLETIYTPEPVGVGDALRAVEELRAEVSVLRMTLDDSRREIDELRARLEGSTVNELRNRVETIEGRLG